MGREHTGLLSGDPGVPSSSAPSLRLTGDSMEMCIQDNPPLCQREALPPGPAASPGHLGRRGVGRGLPDVAGLIGDKALLGS